MNCWNSSSASSLWSKSAAWITNNCISSVFDASSYTSWTNFSYTSSSCLTVFSSSSTYCCDLASVSKCRILCNLCWISFSSATDDVSDLESTLSLSSSTTCLPWLYASFSCFRSSSVIVLIWSLFRTSFEICSSLRLRRALYDAIIYLSLIFSSSLKHFSDS